MSINNTKYNKFENLILKHEDKNWDWICISSNHNISLDFICENLKFNWDWNIISQRIPLYIILENQDLPWNWNEVSKNQNITIKDI